MSRTLLSLLVLAGLLLAPALSLAQAPAITTTTLALQPGSNVDSGTSLTLTAAVNNQSSQPVLYGSVLFCNASVTRCVGPAVLATAQLLASGQAQGTATVKLRLGLGSHSIKAIFTGTNSYAASTSAAKSVTVNGNSTNATSISLAATGNPGNYTLTASLSVSGTVQPGGDVSFIDTANGNASLGQAPLVGPATFGFAPLQNYATGGQLPEFTAIGDFNGDGIPDIAVPDYYNDVVTILLGAGDGTFQLGQSYSVGAYPTFVAVGDLNGDGKLDLVVVNTAGGNAGGFGVLLGNGDGTFQPQTQYYTGSITFPTQAVIADFNGDGVPDLAVVLPVSIPAGQQNGQDSNIMAIFIGNGDGTFQPQVNYDAGGAGTYDGQPSLVAADFNNDGKLDLLDNYVYTTLGSGGVQVTHTALTILFGNGDGTFQAPTLLPAIATFNPVSVTVGDFNGDGNADIAAASIYGDQLIVMLGKGDGSFQPAVTYDTSISCQFCGQIPIVSSLAQGNFNGQGKTDLIMTYNFGYVEILSGNGDGTFQSPMVYLVLGEGPIALADFNGDGVTDIAEPGGTGPGAEIALGQWIWTATLNNLAVQGANTLGGSPPLYCCLAEATYGSDINYAASISNTVPLISALVQTTTATTLVVSPSPYAAPGQSVTLTATVAPSTQGSLAAGGQVTFFDGSTQIGSAVTLANGKASTTTASLALGAHSLTAVYSGDVNFTGSTSTAIALTIASPGFTISQTPPSLTARQGQTAQVQLTVTPTGGFKGLVTLSCSSLPSYSGCSFTPATVTADGTGGLLTAQVSISSFGPNIATATEPDTGARSGPVYLAMLGLPMGFVPLLFLARNRKLRKRLLLALLALPIAMGALSGCQVTNCCSMPSTSTGAYAVTVTATSSSPAISKSAVLNLTITP